MTIEISIIVPTYNEARNIKNLVISVHDALETTEYTYEIVVVDDDSPDRTWAVARALGDEYPVTVIRRTAVQGLATAVVRGIEEATHDVVCVMDADLQHPPEELPEVLGVYKNHDAVEIVIGSRMTDSGSFGDSTWFQRVQTYGANAVAWALFPETRSVRDVQSGFFVSSKDVVANADLEPRGYKILLELLVISDVDTDTEVTEVGYVFDERQTGESKLDTTTMVNYLVHVASLWRRKHGYPVDRGYRKLAHLVSSETVAQRDGDQ